MPLCPVGELILILTTLFFPPEQTSTGALRSKFDLAVKLPECLIFYISKTATTSNSAARDFDLPLNYLRRASGAQEEPENMDDYHNEL